MGVLSRQLKPAAIAKHMRSHVASPADTAAAAATLVLPDPPLPLMMAQHGQLRGRPPLSPSPPRMTESEGTGSGRDGSPPPGPPPRAVSSPRGMMQEGGGDVGGGDEGGGGEGRDAGPSLLQLYRLMDSDDFDVERLADLHEHLGPLPLASASNRGPHGRAREESLTRAFIHQMEATGFVGSDPLLLPQQSNKSSRNLLAGAEAGAGSGEVAGGGMQGDAEEEGEEDEDGEAAISQEVYKGRWTDPRLFRTIRQVVSLNKKRFQDQGFDLDLTYITPRIIAMGFPSENAEGIYRNPRSEVQAFFEKRHSDHYKVYNLCGERTYEANIFANRVALFPFEDHNAPALQMIEDMMVDVSAWLDDHPKNVVAVHCKAGKGRTGLMVCCLLLWRGYFRTMAESLDFYAKMRTDDMDGVTIPSQRRFCLYFEHWLSRPGCARSFSPEGPPALRITYIALEPAPKTISMRDSYWAIMQSGGRCWRGEKLDDSRTAGNGRIRSSIVGLGVPGRKPSLEWDWTGIGNGPLDLLRGGVVRGDVRMELHSKDKRALRFWFHTAFVENGQLKLGKGGIDGPHKDRKSKHYEPEFTVTVYFDTNPNCEG